MNKLKSCKETVLKNCKCLKFSNGSQYWAAASAINVVVYDSKSFQQLMTFQGHMMSVMKISWAPGDQVLFSAGLDGNVYGWPVAKEGRLDVIAASNRSSTILDVIVDSPSTSFYSSTQKDAEADGCTK
jgi:WD40 repeat protein